MIAWLRLFGHLAELIARKSLTFLQMAKLLASKACHYFLIVLSSSESLGVSVRPTRDEHAGKYYHILID